MRTFLTCILAAFVLTSCSESGVYGNAPDPDTNFISLNNAIESRNFDREIVVRGQIDRVCQDEGCWMTLADTSSHLQISFLEAGIEMPLNASGEVIVRGIIREEYDQGKYSPKMFASGARLLQP